MKNHKISVKKALFSSKIHLKISFFTENPLFLANNTIDLIEIFKILGQKAFFTWKTHKITALVEEFF